MPHSLGPLASAAVPEATRTLTTTSSVVRSEGIYSRKEGRQYGRNISVEGSAAVISLVVTSAFERLEVREGARASPDPEAHTFGFRNFGSLGITEHVVAFVRPKKTHNRPVEQDLPYEYRRKAGRRRDFSLILRCCCPRLRRKA